MRQTGRWWFRTPTKAWDAPRTTNAVRLDGAGRGREAISRRTGGDGERERSERTRERRRGRTGARDMKRPERRMFCLQATRRGFTASAASYVFSKMAFRMRIVEPASRALHMPAASRENAVPWPIAGQITTPSAACALNRVCMRWVFNFCWNIICVCTHLFPPSLRIFFNSPRAVSIGNSSCVLSNDLSRYTGSVTRTVSGTCSVEFH
jgi:hypothetical protein